MKSLVNDYKLTLLSDLGNWLSFLAMGDNYISQDEVDFINEYLQLDFNKNQIESLLCDLNDDFINDLPLSFVMANELDLLLEKILQVWAI